MNEMAMHSLQRCFCAWALRPWIATGTKSVSLFELLAACNRANFRLKKVAHCRKELLCTLAGILLQLQEYKFELLTQKGAKIPDYNIANFDVLKLPVLEVCFYTPRSEKGELQHATQTLTWIASAAHSFHWIINRIRCQKYKYDRGQNTFQSRRLGVATRHLLG